MAWEVETSGFSRDTILVVKRYAGKRQELARDDKGRIIWFESRKAAQGLADELNSREAQS